MTILTRPTRTPGLSRSTRFALALLVASVTACDGADLDAPISEDVTFRALHDNAIVLHGARLDGIDVQGIDLAGADLQGVGFQAINLAKVDLDGVELELAAFGGSLRIGPDHAADTVGVDRGALRVTDGSTTLAGNRLRGAELELLANGKAQRIRIEGVVADANDPDISYTSLSYRTSEGTWTSVCTDGAALPTEAIVLEGAFDSSGRFVAETGAITFACRGSAAAQCIASGYVPWAEREGVPLGDYFQACITMTRADYCGTNTPYTTNDTPIDVADHGLASPLRSFDSARVIEMGWVIEAEWGADGAHCFNTPRNSTYQRSSIPCHATVPTCPADGSWMAGALLMNRANPNSFSNDEAHPLPDL
jgi:hypothetical protein